MKIRFTALFAALLMLLCSCGEESGTPAFPAEPDMIVAGVEGDWVELRPGDEEYEKIFSAIVGRVEKSDYFGTLKLIVHDIETGEHVSEELRAKETFVEFIYDEPAPQSFLMAKAGRTYETKEITVQRIFFSLRGKDHDCIFIGKDAEYKSATTLGYLEDDTSLITFVREMLDQAVPVN